MKAQKRKLAFLSWVIFPSFTQQKTTTLSLKRYIKLFNIRFLAGRGSRRREEGLSLAANFSVIFQPYNRLSVFLANFGITCPGPICLVKMPVFLKPLGTCLSSRSSVADNSVGLSKFWGLSGCSGDMAPGDHLQVWGCQGNLGSEGGRSWEEWGGPGADLSWAEGTLHNCAERNTHSGALSPGKHARPTSTWRCDSYENF